MATRRSPERYEHHRLKTRARAAAQSPDPPQPCAASGCRKPTQRSSGDGFSTCYCRDHVEHLARHGSTWRQTPRKADIEPFRKAARRWLRAHRERPFVQQVLASLVGLLARSGTPESAWSLKGLPPQDRARIALAKIGREAKGAPAEKLLIIALSFWAWLEAQGADGRFADFRQVQIAKAAKRLASGTHKTRAGTPMPSKYPPSSGSYLRIMGRQIDDLAGLVAERAWREVLSLMQPHAAAASPSRPQPSATASPAPPQPPAAAPTAAAAIADEDERDRQACIARWGRAEGERMADLRNRMRKQARDRAAGAAIGGDS
jgi:hypothetical protein